LIYRYRSIRIIEFLFIGIILLIVGTCGSYFGAFFMLGRRGGGLNEMQRYLLNHSSLFWVIFGIVGFSFLMLIIFKFLPKLSVNKCLKLRISNGNIILVIN